MWQDAFVTVTTLIVVIFESYLLKLLAEMIAVQLKNAPRRAALAQSPLSLVRAIVDHKNEISAGR